MDYEGFKKIVESCHLNFLIGSGASRPFLKTLNNVEVLLTQLANDDLIDDESKIIIETSIKYHYLKKCIEGNLSIESAVNKNLNETFNNYSELIKSIQTILAKRRSNLVSKQTNLFTSNMDIFLELTLEQNHLAYNDGFFGRINPVFGTENFHNTITKTSTHFEYQSEVPLFNLFKLHGSVNWCLDGEKIIYDQNLSTLEEVSMIELQEDDIVEIEYPEGEDWKTKSLYNLIQEVIEKEYEIDNIHHQYLEAFQNLVMINPTKQKFETTTRDLTFYELLRMYSNHLERENSVLFVMGFSFEDEHIREITKRVAKANPTLTIIIFAFDKAAKERIFHLLGEQPNIKFIWDGSDENPVNYSLDVINSKYFKKLANELSSSKSVDQLVDEVVNSTGDQNGANEEPAES